MADGFQAQGATGPEGQGDDKAGEQVEALFGRRRQGGQLGAGLVQLVLPAFAQVVALQLLLDHRQGIGDQPDHALGGAGLGLVLRRLQLLEIRQQAIALLIALQGLDDLVQGLAELRIDLVLLGARQSGQGGLSRADEQKAEAEEL